MRAVTKLLSQITDNKLDLTSFAKDNGFLFAKHEIGIAAQGVAIRVKPIDALSTLNKIEHQNLSSIENLAPIALGCIPFDIKQPHDFVIPRIVVGRTPNNEEWITIIDDAEPD
ncbi:MAG: hypothetical protein EBT42_01750, partial [Actinobacteria bacterium]|nr:hypothetical protein [Actinomycetota bacterium]